jgi:hypothetical protein
VGWQLGAILYEINTLPWTYAPPLPGSAADAPNEEGEGETTAARVGSSSGRSIAVVLICSLASAIISMFLTRIALARTGLWQQKSANNDDEGENDTERAVRRNEQQIELPSFSTAAWSFKRKQYQPIP